MRFGDIVKLVLKLGLAVGLVIWLIDKGVLDIQQVVKTARWYHYAGGVFLCFMVEFFGAVRWRILVERQGVSLTLFEALKLTMIGQFFSYALPGGVSGDMVKGYYLVKASSKGKTNAFVSIIMDRLIGFWAMSFMATCGLLLKWDMVVQDEKVAFMASSISLVFLGFCIVIAMTFFISEETIEKRFARFLPSKLNEIFMKVYSSFRVYSAAPSSIAQAFGLSVCSQSISVIFMALAGHHILGMSIDWSAFIFAVPLGFMAMAIPIAPAGIGVGQAALFFLFNLVIGRETNLGPTVITAFQFCMFCAAVPGIFYYLRSRSLLKEAANVG